METAPARCIQPGDVFALKGRQCGPGDGALFPLQPRISTGSGVGEGGISEPSLRDRGHPLFLGDGRCAALAPHKPCRLAVAAEACKHDVR